MAEDILIEAIKNRKMIDFNYENKPIRNAAPHAIYISSAGNKNMDAFQFDGYSESGNLPDWRNFTLSKIENLSVLDETFEIADGYNPLSNKYNNSIYKI